MTRLCPSAVRREWAQRWPWLLCAAVFLPTCALVMGIAA